MDRRQIPPLVKKSRSRKYISHFTAHILGIHGARYLHLYDVSEIREIRAELIDKRGLTVKTAKNVINATLRAFFRDAAAEGLIERNPFDELPPKFWPTTIDPEPDPFTEEERDEILKYFFAKYWGKWPHGCVFLYMLFWHGIRPSELTGRMERVEPENRQALDHDLEDGRRRGRNQDPSQQADGYFVSTGAGVPKAD